MISRWNRSVFVCAALVLTLLGCGGESGPLKVPVTGVVTLDGQPVPQGQIVLSDAAGVTGSSGGDIREGRFSVKSTTGSKKVSISSMQVVPGKQGRFGGIQGDPVGEANPADVYEEAIPSEYNAQTTLTVEVTAAGPNEFPLALTKKSKAR